MYEEEEALMYFLPIFVAYAIAKAIFIKKKKKIALIVEEYIQKKVIF